MTRQAKNSPFEVLIPSNVRIDGVVLANQLRSVDWLAREADFAGKAPNRVVEDVVGIITAIMA